MRFYGSVWVLTGPYKSLFVFMDSNRCVCVFFGPYATLLVLMRSYKSCCVLIVSNAFL